MSEMILVGRYQIENQIGLGGMSVVYRAMDNRTNREVAVKILKPDLRSDKIMLEQFRRETQIMGKIQGTNVVHVIDSGTDGDREYMVMDYVPGRTLKDMISEDKKLEPKKACEIMNRVLAGLASIHKEQVVHQDLKPQNVLVSSDRYVFLTDFGIAAMEGSQPVTQSNGVLGTVHYMSPEQIQRKTVSHLSDLYSAGILFYELLTGTVPYGGDGETDAEITAQHLTDSDIFSRLCQQGVPEEICRVVHKAMRVNPAERYQTAKDMASDIQACVNSLNIQVDIEQKKQDPENPLQKQKDEEKKTRYLRYTANVLLFLAVIGVLLLGFQSILDQVVHFVEAPYLLDLTEEGAQWTADKNGIQLIISRRVPSDTVPEGRIIYQSPAGGINMRRGEGIYVTVSTGIEHKTVPYLRGMTAEEATQQLEKLGLVSLLYAERVMSDLPWGTVMEQLPAEGTTVEAGSVVQLKVSGGCVTLPNLKLMPLVEALNTLEALNLDVQEIRYVETDNSNAWGKVGAQQFMDAQGNLLRDADGNILQPGAQAMAHTRVILAVYQAPEGAEIMEDSNRTAGEVE